MEETGRRIDGFFHDILTRVSALEVPAAAPQTSRARLDFLREAPLRLVRLCCAVLCCVVYGGWSHIISWGHFQAAVDADLLALQERVVDALAPAAADTSAPASDRVWARWDEIRTAVRQLTLTQAQAQEDGSAVAGLGDIAAAAALIHAKAEEVFSAQTLLAW